MNRPVETKTESLTFSDVDFLKKELVLTDPKQIAVVDEPESEINEQASKLADQLFNMDPQDLKAAQESRASVETMGMAIQKESAHRSAMLREPISKLSKRGEDGGEVANALVDLKLKVEELDPAQFNFSPGWFTRTLGFLPFIGQPIKRYFTRYESADTVLHAIKASLEKGQQQLQRDNITLRDDQAVMNDLTKRLEKAVQLGQLIDLKLEAKLERETSAGDQRHKFIQEEILFPLRQRIQDLQQQMVVNQQGFLAIEMIIRNNKELIRGVTRALNVTMSALQVAVTLALALANQKIVLDKVQSVNETTNNLIAGTAKRLKEQGAEIHKQAASTQLDLAVLKEAFTDIRAALDDVSKFRQEALPKMAQTIIELNEMTVTQGKAIQDLEDGNKVSKSFTIDI